MEDQVGSREHIVVEDKKLEAILNAVDDRTVHQQVLHVHISDGFMALARERYANPSSSERKGEPFFECARCFCDFTKDFTEKLISCRFFYRSRSSCLR